MVTAAAWPKVGPREEQGEAGRGFEDPGGEDEPDAGPGEQRRRGRPGTLGHHAGVAVESESEGGRAVGDDVDPQQLDGEQGYKQVPGFVAQIRELRRR